VNEAALLATRRKINAVSKQDFDHAVERIVAGLENRYRPLNPLECEVVACHEMGHALLAMALRSLESYAVSIILWGDDLGYPIQRPAGDCYLTTR
jgi:cell division protease FtsH